MVISVFTLVICLAVVALSGVAVLRITLVDQSKPATTRSRVPRAPAESESEPTGEIGPAGESEPTGEPSPLQEQLGSTTEPTAEPRVEPSRPESPRRPDATDRPPAPAKPRPAADPATVVIEAHRARSVGLLVALLSTLGGVLALVVAVLALVATAALRAALGS